MLSELKTKKILFLLLISCFLLVACGEQSTPFAAPLTSSLPVSTLLPSPSPTPMPTLKPAIVEPTATTIVAPTATPVPAPLEMTNSVSLKQPPSDFPAVTTNPNNLAEKDLSEYSNALNNGSKADIEQIRAMNVPVYNIALRLAPATKSKGWVGAGHEQIFYTNNSDEAMSGIYFWLYANAPITDTVSPPIAVSNVEVNGQVAATSLENNRAILYVKLGGNQTLQSGETVAIEMDFTLEIGTNTDSYYFRYDAPASTLALLYWYPQVAVFDRKITGGWDTHPYNPIGDITNSQTSLFKVWLTTPADEVIAANAPNSGVRDNHDGTKTSTFVSGPVRDFAAALNPNYQSDSREVRGIKVVSYFSERDRTWGEKALSFAVNALQTYSRCFWSLSLLPIRCK